MSECQYPFGFFCSSIRNLVVIHYVKIILGEYTISLMKFILLRKMRLALKEGENKAKEMKMQGLEKIQIYTYNSYFFCFLLIMI